MKAMVAEEFVGRAADLGADGALDFDLIAPDPGADRASVALVLLEASGQHLHDAVVGLGHLLEELLEMTGVEREQVHRRLGHHRARCRGRCSTNAISPTIIPGPTVAMCSPLAYTPAWPSTIT